MELPNQTMISSGKCIERNKIRYTAQCSEYISSISCVLSLAVSIIPEEVVNILVVYHVFLSPAVSTIPEEVVNILVVYHVFLSATVSTIPEEAVNILVVYLVLLSPTVSTIPEEIVNILVVYHVFLSPAVSTIPEETEDQMVPADRKLELQQEPLMEVNEDDVQTSTRSEPVTTSQKSDTAVKADVKTGPNKMDAQKSVADLPKVTVARSEVKSESTVGKRVVAKQEQCKGLVEVKVDGDSVNDTVVMNAAAAKTSVKSNAEVALSSPRNVTKMPSEHTTQKVSPKFQQNGVKPSVGGSQKVNIPPLVKTSDKAVKSDSTEYKSQRIQRKDTDRTQPKESSPQPAKLPDAIVGRNFEDTSNTVQHRRQAAQPRGGRGPTPNPLILKESQRTKVVSNKMKQGVKFPPLLSTATGGGEKRRKSTSGSRHSDRPKTRDSLISVPFDPSLIDYYSDDFDDSSDSDVDEGECQTWCRKHEANQFYLTLFQLRLSTLFFQFSCFQFITSQIETKSTFDTIAK